MEQPVGHVDFYPNGGTDQPGCSLMDLPVNLNTMVKNADKTADSVGRHLVACSHTRAIQLYIESLRKDQPCVMVGQECSTYEEFKMVGTIYYPQHNGQWMPKRLLILFKKASIMFMTYELMIQNAPL